MMKAPIELVLDRLEHTRKTGNNRFMGRCPAHPDRTPSLAITEGNDGRALLHCFAGCRIQEILSALSLEMKDLFPGGTQPWH